MLKANLGIVQRVIINMSEVDGVRDFRRYFINSLYNETLTHYFNEGCCERFWLLRDGGADDCEVILCLNAVK